MEVVETTLEGVLLLKPRIFRDDRGAFLESFSRDRYAELGIVGPFVQDNVSTSKRGVLRGLHFQNPRSQGKLLSVYYGEVFDVAVDLRTQSPTFGQSFGALLSSDNGHQLWIPAGFAHGFLTTSETAVFQYKCTDFYQPDCDHSLKWDDPDLKIPWPSRDVLVSAKDKAALSLRELQTQKFTF